MNVEQCATLIWRFIGLAFVLMALPGVVFQSASVMRSVLLGASPAAWASPQVTVLYAIMILIGVAVMRYSKSLGRITSHGV